MQYPIFRNNILVTKVKPLDSSELVQKKQTEDYVRLDFVLEEYVDILIGDYITFEKTGQKYQLNTKPEVEEAPKAYRYTCIFEGGIHSLRKTKALLLTEKIGGGTYIDYKFPLTGNAQTFLSFIVECLNRNGGDYKVGNAIETDEITVNFNNWNILQSISQLSVLLNFDWYLEGDTLHFEAKQVDKALTFQIRNGLTKIKRERVANEYIETVVYGYGATQNVPPRTAEEGLAFDSENLTENRLSFVGVDGESKLEKNIDKYGRIESVQEFNDIYPQRTGTVTDIDSTDERVFYDTGIEFDINEHLLPGIEPKITFLTGKLIGLTFSIAYDHETNKITMDYYSDESGSYPNGIIFAEVGDSYKLFDIVMPEIYVQEAQERLEQATQEYIDKQSDGLEIYEGFVDNEYIQRKDIVLDLGDIIRIVSTSFGIDKQYEIKELTQGITNPYRYNIKFGDIIPKSLITLLKSNDFTTQQYIYSVEKNTLTTNQITNNLTSEEVEWQTW